MVKKAHFDDCDRPACDDIANMMHQAASASATTKDGSLTQAATPRKQKLEAKRCPPGIAELGQSSWTLLHSMVRT
jgi:hypothetical protein